MSKKAFIIVLNWNGYRDTIECIGSLKNLTSPDYKILIVDNGSTDGSEEILRKRFPDITVIQTGKNLGFSGGANAGIRHALKQGADYIILLNNDTVVAPDFARELIKTAEREFKAGILCSKVYFYDRPDIIWYAGASFNPWLGWGRHRGYNLKDTGQFDKTEETERPCGCSIMVTREFCEKVGLLDEEYFSYAEDVDWGMRAKRAGFRVLYVPASKVWHKVSISSGGVNATIPIYYGVRNILRCIDKNQPIPSVLSFFRSAVVVIAYILSLFTRGIPKIAGLRCIYQGVMDYIRGRFGEFKGI